MICLVGNQYGSPVTSAHAAVLSPCTWSSRFLTASGLSEASYTQWEFLLSKESRRPTYTFLTHPAFQPDNPSRDTPAQQQARIAFRDWIRQTGEHTSLLTTIEKLIEDVLVLPFPDLSSPKPIVLPYSTIGTLFKGRSEFLTQLRESLQRTASTGATAITGKAVHGLGGVGKTRLAVEYAWQHADDYSAVLFITADSPDSLTRQLAELTGPLVLNLPEQHATEDPVKVAAALRWLSNHPGWFLILDNVDTEDAARTVEQLLPKLQQGHVLITSRLGRWQGQVQPLELDVLSPEAAAQFLLERTQPQGGQQRGRKVTAEDPAEATALAKDLDGLALALEQAAAYLVTRRKSIADYRQLWQQRSAAVRSWHDSRQMQYPQSIVTTWQTTLDQLSEDEQRLLNQLAWYSAEPIPLLLFRQEPDDSTQNPEIERLDTAVATLPTSACCGGTQTTTPYRYTGWYRRSCEHVRRMLKHT
ncbi:MAG: NB-ARC domain-containing protein [Planctomycetota bacterium]